MEPLQSSSRRVRFTKMQGAGNDFVVLDATREPLALGAEEMRRLGDRRFGVGADQILIVERPTAPGMDFSYRIFNNTGDEVEHCGNGARCFARYVRDRGLIGRDTIRVQTVNNELELHIQDDGRVRVDMNAPRFEHADLPFDAAGLVPTRVGGFETWPLDVDEYGSVDVAVLSMGNPHAVMRVDDVDHHPVALIGPLVESHARFPRRVNAGFLQVLSRTHARLRVHERDAGETLACGTGACAAIVAGIRLGWLDTRVDVDMHGGRLTVEWAGGPEDSVFLTGPATTVFEGEIEL
ncbi:MAG: diaminopimelate epimerase [Vitreoscilla sp.]|jgi:diaminopimelate epimerase